MWGRAHKTWLTKLLMRICKLVKRRFSKLIIKINLSINMISSFQEFKLFQKDLFYHIYICWFWNHFVHFTDKCFWDIRVFCMACKSYYFRLLYPLTFVVTPNLNWALIAIEDRHGAVHEDDSVGVPSIHLKLFLDNIECLLTVAGRVD